MQEIKVYINKRQLLKGVLLMAGVTLGSIALWRIEGGFILASCMVLFVLLFIYMIYQMIDPRPVLIINEFGVSVRHSMSGTVLASWEDIRGLWSRCDSEWITFFIIDEEEVISRYPPWKRRMLDWNRDEYDDLANFNIHMQGLKCDREQLRLDIEAYFQHAKVSEE